MLLKFFLNSHSKAHLRGLAEEFGESTNSIRHELNNLSKAGYLVSNGKGNIIEYSANIDHPLYPELKNLLAEKRRVDPAGKLSNEWYRHHCSLLGREECRSRWNR